MSWNSRHKDDLPKAGMSIPCAAKPLHLSNTRYEARFPARFVCSAFCSPVWLLVSLSLVTVVCTIESYDVICLCVSGFFLAFKDTVVGLCS